MYGEHLIETFQERLPWHGLATDDFQYGTRRLPVELAIQKAIIQYNWRHSVGWLVYDVDRNTAAYDWDDRHAPPPNMIAINMDNGHAHLFYGLEKPVHKYAGASPKPMRYLAAVDVALTGTLEADPGYTKLLAKNPTHDRWLTIFPRLDLYDLDELESWLDMQKFKDRRRRLPDVGYGRNCTLFENLRRWAYRERRREQLYLSESMFYAAVRGQAFAINATFNEPLPDGEVRTTATSVARWTWRNMSAAGFKAWQKRQSDKGNFAKKAKALQLRERILETKQQCPDLAQEDIAALLGVRRETVNRHMMKARREGVTFPISDKHPLGGSSAGGSV